MEESTLVYKDIEIQVDLSSFYKDNYCEDHKPTILRTQTAYKRNLSSFNRKNRIFNLLNDSRANKNFKNSHKLPIVHSVLPSIKKNKLVSPKRITNQIQRKNTFLLQDKLNYPHCLHGIH